MDENTTVLPAQENPQLDQVMGTVNIYMQAWMRGRFAFLPMLHESVGRHAEFFREYTDGLLRCSKRVTAELNNTGLDTIAIGLSGAGATPEDRALYLELFATVLGKAIKKLQDQVLYLAAVPRELKGVPQPDPASATQQYTREMAAQVGELDTSRKALAAKRDALQLLQSAIATLEANSIEALFNGLLPSSAELKAAQRIITTQKIDLEAVELALERVRKVLGGVLDGVRYARLADERRLLHSRIDELEDSINRGARRQLELQHYLEVLAGYPALTAHRGRWEQQMLTIRQHLDTHLVSVKKIDTQKPQNVLVAITLLKQLADYQRLMLKQYGDSQ